MTVDLHKWTDADHNDSRDTAVALLTLTTSDHDDLRQRVFTDEFDRDAMCRWMGQRADERSRLMDDIPTWQAPAVAMAVAEFSATVFDAIRDMVGERFGVSPNLAAIIRDVSEMLRQGDTLADGEHHDAGDGWGISKVRFAEGEIVTPDDEL